MTRLLPLALLLFACSEAEESVLLVAPHEVEFSWNPAFNERDDGMVAVVPIEVMVYDSESGLPRAAATIELRGQGAVVLPQDAVMFADPEDDAALWDSWRDAFVQVDSHLVAPAMALDTGEDGLIRFYALIDEVPGAGAELGVIVTYDDLDERIALRPR